eukprot:703167-Amphidinium_carterae.1
MTKAVHELGGHPAGGPVRDHAAAHTPGPLEHETARQPHVFPCSSAGSGKQCAQGSTSPTRYSPTSNYYSNLLFRTLWSVTYARGADAFSAIPRRIN